MTYKVALPPSLSNIHSVFHVSQLQNCVSDLPQVVQIDDVSKR